MSSFKSFLLLILSTVLVMALLWDSISGGDVLKKKDSFVFTVSEVSVPHGRKHMVEKGILHVENKK